MKNNFIFILIFFINLIYCNEQNFYNKKNSLERSISLNIESNNPFYPNQSETTTIVYSVKNNDSNVKIYIFSLSGRFVRNLGEFFAQRNTNYNIVWDGRDENNQIVPTGIYIVCIFNDTESVRKLVGVINK